jgi:hypothetical protein
VLPHHIAVKIPFFFYFIQVNFDIKEGVLYDFTIFGLAAGNS